MELMKPKIKINKLVKKFGIFTALDSINVEIYPNEIHALLGDNGAGKSTLIKILSGIYPSTSGEILIDDKVVNFRNPHDASLEGIGTVYQDLALVPSMSLSRNFFMGRELTKGPKSLGVLNIPLFRSLIPFRGSYISPKFFFIIETAIALTVKSLLDKSSLTVVKITLFGFLESALYVSFLAAAISISISE